MNRFEFVKDVADWVYDLIKAIIVALWLIALDVLEPISSVLGLLIVFFMFNCLIGYRAGAKQHKESFNMKKIGRGLLLLLTFLVILILTYASMMIFNEENFANFFMKSLTWFLCYCYLANISRNMVVIFEGNENVVMFHKIITIDIKHFIANKFKGGLK